MTVTMDSPKLRKLARVQLQSLAKREFVRAVGKTEDIIRRLVQKHPGGVPVVEDTDDASGLTAPPKPNVLKMPHEDTTYSPSVVPVTTDDGTDPKGKAKAVAEVAFPSPSSSIETLKLLFEDDELVAGPSNTNHEDAFAPHLEATRSSEALPNHPVSISGEPSPVLSLESPSHQANNDTHSRVQAPHENSNPGWQAEDEVEAEDEIDYPKGAPNHYMVVDALRQFTTLVNAIPSMETRIAENRCLLQRTEAMLEKALPDVRELTVTREYLETFLLGKMKQKRELWDGTGKMKKEDRKLRMEWLRAERKAENEKRWKEANELYAKHGLDPVPLSTFVSESDEEVIGSLQTTPASSRSGSSKRTREDGVDGYSDTDSEGYRKRARA